jgi:hypothetical protein
MISEADATQRLQSALARVDSRLELDRGAIRYLTEPYPGVEFGLRLGEAGALLFMPEEDLTAANWEMRLFKRLEAAKQYLEEFSTTRSRAHRP